MLSRMWRAALVLIAIVHLVSTFEFGSQSQQRACQTMKAGYRQEPVKKPPPFNIHIINSANAETDEYRLRERLTSKNSF